MTRRAGGALGDHGGFGQSVSQAEVTREGWSTETGSAASREFCWGRKKAHEERVAGPARWQVLPRASGARLVSMSGQTLALTLCPVWPWRAKETAHCLVLTALSTGRIPPTKRDFERLVVTRFSGG